MLERKVWLNLQQRTIWLRFLRICLLLMMALMVGGFVTVSKGYAQDQDGGPGKGGDDGIGRAKFLEMKADGKVKDAVQHATSIVNTIPYWGSAFSYGGNIYPYQMVGTNPAQGSATTVVPTEIIPLKVTFANGVSLDGTRKVKSTVNSPIFQKANFSSGDTQYGDAIQRAEFWHDVSTKSGDYHVLLGRPEIYPTVQLLVPATKGEVVQGKHSRHQIGLIDINWFDAQLQSIMSAEHISAKTFPIFLTYNTFVYEGDPGNCCALGYHSATLAQMSNGELGLQTYAFAAYEDQGIFPGVGGDVDSLSHEVAEWYNDPFTDNIVPGWEVPSAPQYGCSNLLEVGDPVAGMTFTVNHYHLQDEVFFPWFARQAPTGTIHGRYTYLGTFTTLPGVCTP